MTFRNLMINSLQSTTGVITEDGEALRATLKIDLVGEGG
jgi:hypothetical protein